MKEWGVRLEKWTLRAQRELWSAVTSASASSVSVSSAHRLARAFLTSEAQRPLDSVCVTLAQIVADRNENCKRMLLPASSDKLEAQAHSTDDENCEEVWEEIELLGFYRAAFGRAEPPSDDEEVENSSLEGDGVATPAEWLTQDTRTQGSRAGESLEAVTAAKKPRLMAPPSSATVPSSGRPSAPVSVVESTAEVPSLPKEVRCLSTGVYETSPAGLMVSMRGCRQLQLESRAVTVAKPLAQLARTDPQPTREAIDEAVKKATALLLEIVNDVHATHTASEYNFRSLCTLLQLEATSDEALFHIAT